jgi:hypothetical protein
MTSHESFGHLQHKLWSKEGPRIKLAIWFPTIKSRESTQSRCMQAECDTPLQKFQGELQVCFKPHPDRRSKQGIMSCQNPKSPNRNNFRTVSGLPLGSPRTNSHLDVALVEWCRVYYMEEGGGFPWIQVMVSQVSPELPVACPSTKGAPKCELTNLLVAFMQVWVSE